jgi:catechol 2,3-dioxygenase-like lactoylglutathione lyase family enzyme
VFRRVTQVAMVVKDVEATARHYWEDLGIGPWNFYTLDPANTPQMTLRGIPVAHSFRAAIAKLGDVALELIQPLDGESLYAEHLATHGEGLHHIALQVDDFEAAKIHLRSKGYAEVQAGRSLGVASYVYFDTDKRLACITEFGSGVEQGKSFPPPERTIP